MRSKVKLMWRNHKMLVIGFAGALIITIFFTSRMMLGIIYWSNHRDEDLAGWMTLGYVSHSYQVRKETLGRALDLPKDGRRRVTLAEIAERRSVDLSVIEQQLLDAIEMERGPE